ncbi:hypothetical protein N9N67_02190 [Bacteriovoracaceae bacterium]|nr:hypothetical protein [Bacteriovoracaceae bacterium]
MKQFILIALLTSINLLAHHPETVTITVNLDDAQVGQTLKNIDILGGGSPEELRFFSSCLLGFRKAIKGTKFEDFSTEEYKEFWFDNYYQLNPADDDVTIDVKTPVKVYNSKKLKPYQAELKKCIESLLMTATVKTYNE